jgi:hypothetical protein
MKFVSTVSTDLERICGINNNSTYYTVMRIARQWHDEHLPAEMCDNDMRA